MNRILLCAALGSILIGGVCLSEPALATAALNTAIIATQQGAGVVFKSKEAGIQFVVSPGWEIETGKDGTVTVSRQQGDTFVVAAISAMGPEASDLTPEAQFRTASAAVFDKDFKDAKRGEPTKATQNGMPVTSQGFTAKRDGVDMRGSVAIIQAGKPILIFVYGTAKNSDDFNNDVRALLGSIKKIA